MEKKTYKNISGAPVLGNRPGKVFEAEIPSAQEKRMIDRGSLEEVDPKSLAEQEAPPVEDEADAADSETGDGDGKKVDDNPPAPPAIPPFGQKKKG